MLLSALSKMHMVRIFISKSTPKFSFCLGCVLLILTLLMLSTRKSILDFADKKIKEELILRPDNLRFKYWEKTPVPLFIDIYFFDWVNPKDLKNKPLFKQMGPYRFQEVRTKVNLKWNDNKTVTFNQMRHWYFDEENSAGKLEDNVTTVDIVPVSLISTSNKMGLPWAQKKMVSIGLSMKGRNLYTRRTVRELLFQGYSDDILNLLNALSAFNVFIENADDIDIPEKFGWFYERNGTTKLEGVFNMETGEASLENLGRTRKWNYENTTGYFPGKCGEIDGSTGEMYPPDTISKTSRLPLFSSDLCRTIYLDYKNPSRILGVPGFRYVGGLDLVDSGQVDPANKCFCNGICSPLGLFNMTECRKAPMFLSYPHFYLADPLLLNQIDGMEPNKDLHEFSLDVEPTYGFPIDVKGRFQINLKVLHDDNFAMTDRFNSTMYLPVMWFDLHATLTPSTAAQMLVLIYYPVAFYIFLSLLLFVSLYIILGPQDGSDKGAKNAY